MEWRVHVECALLVKSLSYFLYSNWWLRYITNNQTLITNSSLPRKNSTEYTERFFGMTYTMTKGDISWKWSVIMWTRLFRQGLVTGSTVLLEKLMRSAVPEIPRIKLSSSLPHSEEPATVQILNKITHFQPFFQRFIDILSLHLSLSLTGAGFSSHYSCTHMPFTLHDLSILQHHHKQRSHRT